MAAYSVDLQGIEQSSNYYSLSGRVNGIQVACVCHKEDVPGPEAEKRQYFLKALAKAFAERAVRASPASEVMVDL